MLWRKKKASGPEPELSEGSDPGVALSDKALDVVSVLVRLYGKHAFDTDTADARSIAALCEEWATRINLGSPRARSSESPLGPKVGSASNGASSSWRDWPGLISFMGGQRRAESEYVVRRLGDLRQAILRFADCLNRTVGEERQADVVIDRQLQTLSSALETRDVTRICAEAELVVDAVRQSMAVRRKREAEQVWALGERVRDLREELSEVRKQAELDPLTQLANRAALDAQLAHIASLGVLIGDAPWLMLVDLDHFKTVNDTYGHPGGDEVLRQVSKCLSRTFLRKQDVVSRYGGEEFAAVLLDTTEAQMFMLTERLMSSVRDLVVAHGGHEISVTLSVGLASLLPGESPGDWLGRADAALYRAKNEGRDIYRVASPTSAAPEQPKLRAKAAKAK